MRTIATEVYTVEEITLQDNKEVTLRPLNIKTLRLFMKKIAELQTLDKIEDDDEREDASTNILVDAAVICLKSQRPELVDRDVAEDLLDMDTVLYIIKICGGVDLKAAAQMQMEMMTKAGRPGTN